MVEDKHAKQAQSGELVVSYDLKMMGGARARFEVEGSILFPL